MNNTTSKLISISNIKLWDVISCPLFEFAVGIASPENALTNDFTKTLLDITGDNRPRLQTETRHEQRGKEHVTWKETVDTTLNDPTRATAHFLAFDIDCNPEGPYSHYYEIRAQRMNNDGTLNFRGEIIIFSDESKSMRTSIEYVNQHYNMGELS